MHISSFINSIVHKFFLSRNEAKLVAVLVYSSFIPVATYLEMKRN